MQTVRANLLFIVVFLCLSACQPSGPATTQFSGTAMTVPYRIVIGVRLSATQQNEIHSIIASVFKEIDTHLNHWNPRSEVSQFNAMPAHQTFHMSLFLAKFMERSGQLVALTEGRFDPTIGPLWTLWRENLQEGRAPTEIELVEVGERVGWNRLQLDGLTVKKLIDGVTLNFDSIAKGYTVDLLTERLRQAGYKNLLVEWGGELKAEGKHPQNRPWRVAIRGVEGDYSLNEVSLNNQALATSGDYLQYWPLAGGDTYTHIVNPLSLKAIKMEKGSLASASVLAPDCMFADALATATIAHGNIHAAQEWAAKLQQNYPEIKFWLYAR